METVLANDYYIYIWYQKSDDKPFYVGKGKEHRYRTPKNRNDYFQKVYKKHGGYSKKIIEGLTEEEALKKEIELIKEYRKKFTLTNLTDGGEGVSGLYHSDETKEKLSRLSKKQWESASGREKLVAARRLSYATSNISEKISKAHQGKVLTEEHRNNIRKAMKSERVIKSLAESHTKYRMIECITPDGETIIFETTKDVANWFISKGYKNAKPKSVINCVAGRSKSLYKHKIKLWKEESA